MKYLESFDLFGGEWEKITRGKFHDTTNHMIYSEPTESESLQELDRFCDAMISIRKEIEAANADDTNNVLKNAPHTLAMLTTDTWVYPYTREQAAYPLDYIHDNKFWPSVRRVDDAYGDRNLVCSCAPIEAYM